MSGLFPVILPPAIDNIPTYNMYVFVHTDYGNTGVVTNYDIVEGVVADGTYEGGKLYLMFVTKTYMDMMIEAEVETIYPKDLEATIDRLVESGAVMKFMNPAIDFNETKQYS